MKKRAGIKIITARSNPFRIPFAIITTVIAMKIV